MVLLRRSLLFALISSFLLCTGVGAEVPVPRLSERVMDFTATLTAEEQRQVMQVSEALEQKKGAQIAVLILPTTKPEEIEQYALRVVEAWKLGRRGVDDGALLLVAKNDRRMRIEVGYGLEGVLSDALAKRIIDEIITPQFRAGQFFPGILAGVSAMEKIISGGELPPPAVSWGAQQGDIRSVIIVAVILIISIIVFFSIITSLFASQRIFSGHGWHSSSGGSWSSGRSFSSGGGFSGGGGSFGGGGASGGW